MADAGMPPSLLVGHSLGGAAALSAATSLPDIHGVATIGAPANVSHVLTQFDPAELDRVMADGQAQVQLAGSSFMIKRSFVEDIGRHNVEEHAAKLPSPSSPALLPTPAKSKRRTPIPARASARATRKAAWLSLPQVKQCAKIAQP
jgi:pimeloyl-ACP methyl ester carboxylesterase